MALLCGSECWLRAAETVYKAAILCTVAKGDLSQINGLANS